MDLNLLMTLAKPMLSNITPEMLAKISKITEKVGKELQDSGKGFDFETIQSIIAENPNLIEDSDAADLVLPPIKVTLSVTAEELKLGKTKKFRAKPNFLVLETMATEKRSTLFKLTLIPEQLEYTIENEQHGRIFVHVDLKE